MSSAVNKNHGVLTNAKLPIPAQKKPSSSLSLFSVVRTLATAFLLFTSRGVEAASISIQSSSKLENGSVVHTEVTTLCDAGSPYTPMVNGITYEYRNPASGCHTYTLHLKPNEVFIENVSICPDVPTVVSNNGKLVTVCPGNQEIKLTRQNKLPPHKNEL